MSAFADLPRRDYQLLLADPPWQTVLWSGAVRTPTQKQGEDHYPTMTQADLLALPVGDIAAPDAALAMWVIGSHLDQALELGRAWGFRYTTDLFYWLKQKRIRPDQFDLFTQDLIAPPIGMGKYTRKQIEPCWLFTRGRGLPVLDHAVRQLILAPKREHSRKPVQQYAALDALFGPDLARVELFSRTDRPGWDSWGNQQNTFAEAQS